MQSKLLGAIKRQDQGFRITSIGEILNFYSIYWRNNASQASKHLAKSYFGHPIIEYKPAVELAYRHSDNTATRKQKSIFESTKYHA